MRQYLDAEAKSPTISTLGKDPGPGSVTAALRAKAGRPSWCDPHADRIAAKMELGFAAQHLYQDLRAEVDFGGSYQSVKRFVRARWRAEPAPTPSWNIGLREISGNTFTVPP